MSNNIKQWVIKFTFSDNQQTKYVVCREYYWQAKEIAESTKSEWNDTEGIDCKLTGFDVQELDGKR